MNRHPYRPECQCDRCVKEKVRRTAQSAINPQRIKPIRKARTRTRQPIVGSAEWAETRGDDLGYSGDY